MSFDPAGGSAAQRAAEAELRKPEYHRDDPDLLDRVLHWIGRRLNSLFDGSTGGSATLILLVLLLAAVIFAVVKAGPPRRVARLAAPGDGDPLRPLAARDHRRLAAQFAAAGRRAEAMREWLRAAVQTIEDRGVLMPDPGRTGAATARQAGPLLPAAAPDLRAATGAFDEVWFGGRAAIDADVAVAQAAADGVLSARIERALPGPNEYAVPW
ncbi:MAG: putative integral rane protein [Pseudonocardiales bacterium]|nr:putative integral rane protein [Pseudonocardiales bacterium]